jgi:predicted nucleotidyltransferase
MQSVIRKTYYNSVKVFWLDRQLAYDKTVQAARKLGSVNPAVLLVILFGSLAEGKALPSSDADILIVVKDSNLRFIDRPARYRAYFVDIGLGIDLFVYTEQEIARGDIPLVRTALSTGKEIYKKIVV